MKKLKEIICRDPLKSRHRVFLYGVIAACLFFIGGIANSFFMIIGLLLLFLTFGYGLLAFRCPICDAYLGERIMNYKHCPNCGENIEK